MVSAGRADLSTPGVMPSSNRNLKWGEDGSRAYAGQGKWGNPKMRIGGLNYWLCVWFHLERPTV